MGPGPAPWNARAFIAALDEVELARSPFVRTYTAFKDAVPSALHNLAQAGAMTPGQAIEYALTEETG